MVLILEMAMVEDTVTMTAVLLPAMEAVEDNLAMVAVLLPMVTLMKTMSNWGLDEMANSCHHK